MFLKLTAPNTQAKLLKDTSKRVQLVVTLVTVNSDNYKKILSYLCLYF